MSPLGMGLFGPVLMAAPPDRPLPDPVQSPVGSDQVCQETSDLAEGKRDESATNAFRAIAAVTAR